MSKYIRLVATVISSVIVKEERRGEIDIPKTSMTGIFQRINDDQYWPVMLQLLVQNVDPSYESFEDNKNSVIFLMESIIDRIGKAKNVSKYSKIFEKWIDSRSNQNQDQLQSEEYLCAFFTFSIDKKFGSDGLEYLKTTKIVDLGSDYLDGVKFGKYQNKRRSLGLNQSGFDNDETITRSITSNLSSASIH